jgi:NAD(P)-dependent dehydrogenase (short-subunit alcohol dehydrogenase family)
MTRSHDINLHGKVVLVTGAASGIGLHAVHGFLAEGAKVVMVDSDDARLQREVKAAWRVSGRDRLLALCCDVGDDGDLDNLMPQVIGHWGTVDVLVNCAGLCAAGAPARRGGTRLKTMVDLHLYALMRLTQLALPLMEKRGGGHILNVYSSASPLAMPDRAAYEATQAGVLVFTRALGRAYRRRNISFTAFSPGPTRPADAAQAADQGPRGHQPTAEKAAAALVEAVKRRSPRVQLSRRGLTRSILGFVDRIFTWNAGQASR